MADRLLMMTGRFRYCILVVVSLPALAVSGCSTDTVPKVYHGRSGDTVLAVPSAIASSVLYDGESDWTAPEKPRGERTDRDPIHMIEFYVDLDHPKQIITDQVARARLLEHSETTGRAAVKGHVVGITVDLTEGGVSNAAEIRSQFTTGSGYPGPAFRAMKPAPSEYGFETRRADWSQGVPDRQRHDIGIFNVDVEYLSRAANTWIFCNDARQSVAPFAPMPTCKFKIVVQPLHAVISGTIDRADVYRWRDLRSAAVTTLQSFVVPRRTAG